MEAKTNNRKFMATSIIGLSSNSLLLSACIISHLVLTKSNKNNINANINYNFKLILHYNNQKTYDINNGNDMVTLIFKV